MALTDKLVSIADSIRAKTGGTEPLTLDEMATAIEGIETGGGGDTTQEDGLITGTLTEYTNDRVESIRDRAFYGATLTKISLPNVKKIGEYAFGMSSSQSIGVDKVEESGKYAFYSCQQLKVAYLPLLTTVDKTYMFNNCKSLERIIMPKANISFDSLSASGCANVKIYDSGYTLGCPSVSFFPALSHLALRHTRLLALSSSGQFSGTPFASGGTGGKCYVPRALIESYQTATNWSTLYAAGTCTFLPLEDYTVDGTTTGEIDWSKIEGVTE
jgi:hypothetical protein